MHNDKIMTIIQIMNKDNNHDFLFKTFAAPGGYMLDIDTDLGFASVASP